MSLDINTLLQSVNLGVEAYIPLYAYLREIFINEAPLLMRLPREAATNESYNIITYDVRPRTYTLNAAITTGATTMVLTDATPLLVGDVIELTASAGSAPYAVERVEVQGQNAVTGLVVATLDGVTVNVRRGVSGTTALANDTTANTSLTLIGNSRTGAEINQEGNRAIRNSIPQQVQTFEFPITMGGKAQAIKTVALPNGVPDIFTLEQRTKLTEMMRDIEYSLYYSLGDRPVATGDRAKMQGFKPLIGTYKSGINVKVNAGASYTILNLFADTIQRCIDGGGNPDLMVCSTNFLSFIATWTHSSQFFMDRNYTELGVAIESFVSAFIGRPIEIVPSYQMVPGSCFVFTSKDLKIRYLRQESFIRRAILGDASMGDYIGDFCGELGHAGWHSYVSGISSAA